MTIISRDHCGEMVSTRGERREVTRAVRPFRAPHHTIPKGHVLGVFNHSIRVLQEDNFAGVLDLTALTALAKLGERKNSPMD
jgi:dihydroxyacetone kinase-like predicted kinase